MSASLMFRSDMYLTASRRIQGRKGRRVVRRLINTRDRRWPSMFGTQPVGRFTCTVQQKDDCRLHARGRPDPDPGARCVRAVGRSAGGPGRSRPWLRNITPHHCPAVTEGPEQRACEGGRDDGHSGRALAGKAARRRSADSRSRQPCLPKLERKNCGATGGRRSPPTIGQAINGGFPWLEVKMFVLQDALQHRPGCDQSPAGYERASAGRTPRLHEVQEGEVEGSRRPGAAGASAQAQRIRDRLNEISTASPRIRGDHCPFPGDVRRQPPSQCRASRKERMKSGLFERRVKEATM
jgi:hypothetical protein